MRSADHAVSKWPPSRRWPIGPRATAHSGTRATSGSTHTSIISCRRNGTMTPQSEVTATRNETMYATPSDRELVITRRFDAPRSLVWSAFTDPTHVPNWHTGPEGFTMPVCEIDLRPGGSFRYVWKNRQGREFTATGTYREVDPPKYLVYATTS